MYSASYLLGVEASQPLTYQFPRTCYASSIKVPISRYGPLVSLEPAIEQSGATKDKNLPQPPLRRRRCALIGEKCKPLRNSLSKTMRVTPGSLEDIID